MEFSKLEKALNAAKNLSALEIAKEAVKAAADAERAKLEAEQNTILAKIGYINRNEKNLLELAEINKNNLVPMPTIDDEK